MRWSKIEKKQRSHNCGDEMDMFSFLLSFCSLATETFPDIHDRFANDTSSRRLRRPHQEESDPRDNQSEGSWQVEPDRHHLIPIPEAQNPLPPPSSSYCNNLIPSLLLIPSLVSVSVSKVPPSTVEVAG